MDKKIDEVVTEHIEFAKIIIEGKGQVGDDPDGLLVRAPDESFHTVPCPRLDPDVRILEDVRPVIKMEGT